METTKYTKHTKGVFVCFVYFVVLRKREIDDETIVADQRDFESRAAQIGPPHVHARLHGRQIDAIDVHDFLGP